MSAINIIFDGPPSHESGRFVEVENDAGEGIHAGEWIERANGLWALRITELPDDSRIPQATDRNNFDTYAGKTIGGYRDYVVTESTIRPKYSRFEAHLKEHDCAASLFGSTIENLRAEIDERYREAVTK